MKPELKKVTLLNYMHIQKYFSENYNLSDTSNSCRFHYDVCILNDHMFRGNDTTLRFYNPFFNDTFNKKEILKIFPQIDEELLDAITNQKKFMNNDIFQRDEMVQWFIDYGTDNLMREFKKLKKAVDPEGKKNNNDFQREHITRMITNGIYSAAVTALYDLKDIEENYGNNYLWEICW